MITVVDAKDVKLTWEPSPTKTVVGYILYWSDDPKIPVDNRIAEECGDALIKDVRGLPDAEEQYFAVVAYDIDGNRSGYSNIVSSPAIPNALPDLDLMIDWNIITKGDE